MYKNLNVAALGVTGHQSEILELALTHNFSGIDVDIVDFTTRAKRRGMDYAARLIRSANLQVGSFRLPLECDADDDVFKSQLSTLPEYAGAAVELGCTRCLTTIAPAGDNRPYHENFEFHQRRLSEICAVLAPAGITLGLGFRAAGDLRKSQAFQFIHDLEAVTLLANMAGAANIGIVLDLWDLAVSGGSIENVRGLPVEQVVAVQVADLSAEVAVGDATEADRRLPAAGGAIDTATFLQVLREKGYDGPVTLMPHQASLEKLRRDVLVKRAAEALAAVWEPTDAAADEQVHAPASS